MERLRRDLTDSCLAVPLFEDEQLVVMRATLSIISNKIVFDVNEIIIYHF